MNIEQARCVFADRATLKVLGVHDILDLATPDSELARDMWRSPRCFLPGDEPEYLSLSKAQSHFEQWWEEHVTQDDKQQTRKFLAQMPLDLHRVLTKLSGVDVLVESEFFVLKRFLYHAQELYSLAEGGLTLDRDDLEGDRAKISDLLQHIHPEANPSPRFFLSAELDDELAATRHELTLCKRGFMVRRKELVTLKKGDYPGARFDLDGDVLLSGELATKAVGDPDLEPFKGMWRLTDTELSEKRAQVNELSEHCEHLEAVIRRRLSLLLAKDVAWLTELAADITRFDVRLTRARLRERLDGSWPTLNTTGSLDIQGGHRPGSHGDAYQAVDFEVGVKPVIVTGPNMGGKSSLLKLVGLCQWCMQHGLPVPAKVYSAPFLNHIIYVGSDEVHGDAIEGLSSFGREIRRLVMSREHTSPTVLWLLDEVGRGTHPQDGALLASEVVDTLHARGDRIVFATHFPMLAMREDTSRWRIAGLKDKDALVALASSVVDLDTLERGLKQAMDYRPVRCVDEDDVVPHDAHLIARLLGW